MDTPFIAELNSRDKTILYTMRLERFYSNLLHPHWYALKIRGSSLQIQCLNEIAATFALVAFSQVAESAEIILGVKTVSLYCSTKQIAVYTGGKEVLLGNETMQSTLEREQVASATSQALNISTNADYISLPQLREMAVELSGENEEFLSWVETNELTFPMRLISGAPYFQKKAIAKAAEQWHNSKIQGVLSRFLGMPVERGSVRATTDAAANGVARDSQAKKPGEPLKNLRTPSGFKPVKTGKDKYAKTVAALAEKLKERWDEYLTHIVELDSIGEPFVKRLAANYNDKDAFAKLHEAFMEYSKAGDAVAA